MRVSRGSPKTPNGRVGVLLLGGCRRSSRTQLRSSCPAHRALLALAVQAVQGICIPLTLGNLISLIRVTFAWTRWTLRPPSVGRSGAHATRDSFFVLLVDQLQVVAIGVAQVEAVGGDTR